MKELMAQELIKFIMDKFKISAHKIQHYIRWIKLYERKFEKNTRKENSQYNFTEFLNQQYPAWQV